MEVKGFTWSPLNVLRVTSVILRENDCESRSKLTNVLVRVNDAFNYHQQATERGTREWKWSRETNGRQIHGVSVQSRRNPATLISRIVTDTCYTLHATIPLVIHWFHRIYDCNSRRVPRLLAFPLQQDWQRIYIKLVNCMRLKWNILLLNRINSLADTQDVLFIQNFIFTTFEFNKRWYL